MATEAQGSKLPVKGFSSLFSQNSISGKIWEFPQKMRGHGTVECKGCLVCEVCSSAAALNFPPFRSGSPRDPSSCRCCVPLTGCSTPPVSLTTCAFHVENSFSDPILEPGVLHISTLTSMSRRCQMCPPLSAVHLLACRFVVLHARDRHRGGRSRNK